MPDEPSVPAAPREEPAGPRGAEGEVVVEVENLTTAYGDQVVLRDVSMTVRRGEVMVILGGSGCGKSTLLKHLIGLQKPTEGTVRVLGVDVPSAPQRTLEDLYRRVGIVYQSGALFGSLTVGENVSLPLR